MLTGIIMKNILKVILMTIPIITAAGDFNAGFYYIEFSKYVVTPVNLMKMKHSFVIEQLEEIHQINSAIKIRKVGESVEGRSINTVSFGNGETKLLLWSQMHGDEPTATAALLSIFWYFAKNFDTQFVKQLHNNLSINAIVMLNPDGAEKFQRRNAQGIDVNRDAQNLQSPEGQILKSMNDEIQPDYGFNLHDMRGRETVGESGEILTIALMAPPFDKANHDNPTRVRAKKLTVIIKETLDQYIDGHVAKYKADYMPRAFGDAFQNWGVSTVLIESGLTNTLDPHLLVRLNFVALLAAFDAISEGYLDKAKAEDYEQIPLEGIELFDLLIKGAQIYNGKKLPLFRADIGINIDYRWEEDRTVSESIIEDIGDLSITTGRIIIEGDNLIVAPGFIVREENVKSAEDAFTKGITTLVSKEDDRQINDQNLLTTAVDSVLEKVISYPEDNILNSENIATYSSHPAKLLQLKKRGIIDVDMTADLLVFKSKNPDNLSFKDLIYVIKDGQIVYQKHMKIKD
jgi:hypothetical protein